MGLLRCGEEASSAGRVASASSLDPDARQVVLHAAHCVPKPLQRFHDRMSRRCITLGVSERAKKRCEERWRRLADGVVASSTLRPSPRTADEAPGLSSGTRHAAPGGSPSCFKGAGSGPLCQVCAEGAASSQNTQVLVQVGAECEAGIQVARACSSAVCGLRWIARSAGASSCAFWMTVGSITVLAVGWSRRKLTFVCGDCAPRSTPSG